MSSPDSRQIMLALTRIQQLVSLLDFKPSPTDQVANQCGLSHVIPSLLQPLAPTDNIPVAMGMVRSRYRESVEHTFNVANELERRIAGDAAPALRLAEALMMSKEDENERILRVRNKRNLAKTLSQC